MQVVAYCEEKATRNNVEQVTEGIKHFSWQDALPTGHKLALNMSLGTLSYLSLEKEEQKKQGILIKSSHLLKLTFLKRVSQNEIP